MNINKRYTLIHSFNLLFIIFYNYLPTDLLCNTFMFSIFGDTEVILKMFDSIRKWQKSLLKKFINVFARVITESVIYSNIRTSLKKHRFLYFYRKTPATVKKI